MIEKSQSGQTIIDHSGYVPYDGADKNLNMGVYKITAGDLELSYPNSGMAWSEVEIIAGLAYLTEMSATGGNDALSMANLLYIRGSVSGADILFSNADFTEKARIRHTFATDILSFTEATEYTFDNSITSASVVTGVQVRTDQYYHFNKYNGGSATSDTFIETASESDAFTFYVNDSAARLTNIKNAINSDDATTLGQIQSGYVPYTGANANLDLGTYDFDTTGKGTFGDGYDVILGDSGNSRAGYFYNGSSKLAELGTSSYAGVFSDNNTSNYVRILPSGYLIEAYSSNGDTVGSFVNNNYNNSVTLGSSGYAVEGYIGNSGTAIYGSHTNGNTFQGASDSYGIYAYHSNSGNTFSVDSSYPNYAYHSSSGNTAYTDSSYGMYGYHSSSGNYGTLGSSNEGVYGYNSSGSNEAKLADSSYAVWGLAGSGAGGYFIYQYSNYAELATSSYAGYFYNSSSSATVTLAGSSYAINVGSGDIYMNNQSIQAVNSLYLGYLYNNGGTLYVGTDLYFQNSYSLYDLAYVYTATLYTDYIYAKSGGNVSVGATMDFGGSYDVTGVSTLYTSNAQVSNLSSNQGVYTDGSSNLTSSIPTSGNLGYWYRSGTTIRPATTTWDISYQGNFTTTGNLGVGAESPGYKIYSASQNGDNLIMDAYVVSGSLPVSMEMRKSNDNRIGYLAEHSDGDELAEWRVSAPNYGASAFLPAARIVVTQDGNTSSYPPGRMGFETYNAITGLNADQFALTPDGNVSAANDFSVGGDITITGIIDVSELSHSTIIDVQPDSELNNLPAVTFFKNVNADYENPLLEIWGYHRSGVTARKGTIGIDQYGRLAFGGTASSTYFAGLLNTDEIRFSGTYAGFLYGNQAGANYDHMTFGARNNAYVKPVWVMTNEDRRALDFDVPDVGDKPELWLHDGSADKTKVLKLSHDGTNGVFENGAGSFIFNQSADNRGIQVNGFDDQAGNNFQLEVTSGGTAQLDGTSAMHIKTVNAMDFTSSASYIKMNPASDFYVDLKNDKMVKIRDDSDSSNVVTIDHNGNIVATNQISSNNISVGTVSPSASFRGAGDIYATSGIKAMEGLYSEAVYQGAGLEVADNEQATTYNNVLYGDATFTAATQLVTDSHGSFTSAYIGQFVKIISSTPELIGATGEIIGVPSSTTLVISVATAGDTVIGDVSNISYVVYPCPNFFVGDNGDIHATIGVNADASFKILCEDSNNNHAVYLNLKAGIDGNTGFDIVYDADTYGGTSAFHINYDATAFDSEDTIGTGLDVVIDNVGATAGHVHVIDVAVSDASNADLEVAALSTHENVDVIHQHLGDPAALDSAWSYDTDTFNDRTTAFNSAGTDVQIFVSEDDYILLASTVKWDQINIVNAINASHTIIPTFHYITDAGAWVAFTPADDSVGFSQSGTIRFDSDTLTTWGQRTVNEVTGETGAVDYYWIKITRTRNILPTPPTEDTIQITTIGSEFHWDKDGNIDCKTIAVIDGVTAPSAISGQAIIYVDTADGDLKVKFGDGTVKTLATDT